MYLEDISSRPTGILNCYDVMARFGRVFPVNLIPITMSATPKAHIKHSTTTTPSVLCSGE